MCKINKKIDSFMDELRNSEQDFIKVYERWERVNPVTEEWESLRTPRNETHTPLKASEKNDDYDVFSQYWIFLKHPNDHSKVRSIDIYSENRLSLSTDKGAIYLCKKFSSQNKVIEEINAIISEFSKNIGA